MARCGVGGFTYDFHFYDGKGPTVSESCGFQSGDFVTKLCETLPRHQHFTVYFNNWLTFIQLQIQLKSWGIWFVGTIRSNRLRDCNLKSEKELKKVGRGAVDSRVEKKSGIHVVRWLDNSAVQLSSTHAAVEPMSTLRRWDKKQHKYVQVPCPAIVRESNEHMGGVDLFDMLMSLYKVDHKSNKWYRRIFFWVLHVVNVLHVAVVNGWILYKRHFKQYGTPLREQLSLLDFTTSVSQALINVNKLPPAVAAVKRGRPTSKAVQYASTSYQVETE